MSAPRPLRARQRPRGFSLLELMAAMAVVAAGMAMLIALLAVTRRKTRLHAERRMARAVAQAAFERLRALPRGELPCSTPAVQPLPPEAAALADLRATASTSPWRGGQGIVHLRVTVTWKSRAGGPRRIVREGLLSDARER
jgi:prepilin-type N-terminal cleavage/methylation domain-containing protein